MPCCSFFVQHRNLSSSIEEDKDQKYILPKQNQWFLSLAPRFLKTAFQDKVMCFCFVPSFFYTVCGVFHITFSGPEELLQPASRHQKGEWKKKRLVVFSLLYYGAHSACTIFCSIACGGMPRSVNIALLITQTFFSGLSGFQTSFCLIRFNRNDPMWNWIIYNSLKAFYDDSGTRSRARFHSALCLAVQDLNAFSARQISAKGKWSEPNPCSEIGLASADE